MKRDYSDQWDLVTNKILVELTSQSATLDAMFDYLSELAAAETEADESVVADRMKKLRSAFFEHVYEQEKLVQNDTTLSFLSGLVNLSVLNQARLDTLFHYLARLLSHHRRTDPDRVLSEMFAHRRKVLMEMNLLGLHEELLKSGDESDS